MYRIQEKWSGGGKLENYQGGKRGELPGVGKIVRGGQNFTQGGGALPLLPYNYSPPLVGAVKLN